ncbi:hypothetical protein DFP72DRAFT_848116 [Ephemerocybe angulata]|uniref:F-box domain-containing protein n=1 Tax=Ephemerocybe angulata TaxID=980116 RepID=A0A8H6HZM0_9AGAR|nr:hypothetical protein DFP72DRAFT_848116 [Tulosesus angulatus]
MASPTLSALPAELKSMVLSFCEAPALASLSRTSRAFQNEAERRLYGTISLHYRSPQSFACLKTLWLNKDKADLVLSLGVTLPRLDHTLYEPASPEADDTDDASSDESDDSSASYSKEEEEEEASQDSEGSTDSEDASSEPERDWGDLSMLKSEDYIKMDAFITLFLPGACQNIGNVVFFSLKANGASKDWTQDIHDAVNWAVESLSGKPSLRTLFIEPQYIPEHRDLSTWLLRYPNLEVLGKWNRRYQALWSDPSPPLQSCKTKGPEPLLLWLEPRWDDKESFVDSMRTLHFFICDFKPLPETPFNVTNECRMPMLDHSPLGQALCKDLSMETCSGAQSVYLFLALQNLSAMEFRGVQNVLNGLLNPRPLGNDDLDVCLKIGFREAPQEIAEVAWHELKLLFISLAAQGLRPVTLEIGAHVPYGTPPQALTKNEMKYGAQRLADVLNDPLLLETWEPLKSARFLQMDLFASRRLRSQPDRWTLRS